MAIGQFSQKIVIFVVYSTIFQITFTSENPFSFSIVFNLTVKYF